MIKVLLWVVSNDGSFFNGAIQILEWQHGGIEIVGVTASEPVKLFKDGEVVKFIPFNEIERAGEV